jgi:hypothetical protein
MLIGWCRRYVRRLSTYKMYYVNYNCGNSVEKSVFPQLEGFSTRTIAPSAQRHGGRLPRANQLELSQRKKCGCSGLRRQP